MKIWQIADLMLLIIVVGAGCALIFQYFSSIASQGFWV